KALILGRLLGFSGGLCDIAVASLVAQGAEQLSLEGFLARLDEYGQAWVRRVAAARARGGVLRYRAIVTPRRIRVGLVVVPASSPMASLNGTDNQFIFTTMRYKKNPLVITGPGAGPAVTAGGILNDVLKLAGGGGRPASAAPPGGPRTPSPTRVPAVPHADGRSSPGLRRRG